MIVHRAGRPLKAGDVVLIPLERLILDGTAVAGTVRGFAGLEPTGVAVLSPKGLVIFDETGSLSPILPRLDEVEGLRSALNILAFPGAKQSG